MRNSLHLPAVPESASPPSTALAGRLQDALEKIVTPQEVEDLVRQIVTEAKTGTAAEKRAARQILLNLIGAKSQAVAPQYVQNNFYSAKARAKKAKDTRSLIVRYLESEGPAGADMIAAEIARPKGDVLVELNGNPDLFHRQAKHGGAWSLVAGCRQAS